MVKLYKIHDCKCITYKNVLLALDVFYGAAAVLLLAAFLADDTFESSSQGQRHITWDHRGQTRHKQNK